MDSIGHQGSDQGRHQGEPYRRIEVITGPVRRRWTACCATARMAGRIASPELLPSVDPLPHLKCSRPGLGGDRHEADQHGNT